MGWIDLIHPDGLIVQNMMRYFQTVAQLSKIESVFGFASVLNSHARCTMKDPQDSLFDSEVSKQSQTIQVGKRFFLAWDASADHCFRSYL